MFGFTTAQSSGHHGPAPNDSQLRTKVHRVEVQEKAIQHAEPEGADENMERVETGRYVCSLSCASW